MAIDDLYNMTPVPEVDPLDLGMAAPPPPPQLPQMSVPVAQRPNTKAMNLAAIAAMITGGPGMAGLGHGLLQGQQMQEQQRQQQDREQRLRYDEETQNYRVQQMAYQQQMQQRQKVLLDAVGGIRQGVSSKGFKSKEQYDQQIEQTAALLQNAYGIRVSPNYFRQAAPYIAPSSQDLASKALDEALNSPLTKAALAKNPDAVFSATIPFDANGDGIPEQHTWAELSELAGRTSLVLPDGQAIVTTKGEGKVGTPFQEILQADLERFRVENRRDPNPKEKQAIVSKAVERSKEKPAADPALAAIAMETAGLRRDLLQTQLQQEKTKPPKEPNQAQFTAAGYAERVQQAGNILDTLEQKIAGMRTVSFKAQEYLPPAGQTGDYQSYDQAARNFINAVLRRESGAVISPMEFDNAKRQYLPMPGDRPETLNQKRQNRMQVLASLKAASGNAFQEPVQTPAAVEQWVRDPVTGKMKKQGAK